MQEVLEKSWHSLEKETLFQELDSSELGLDENEVKKRLRIFGTNTIEVKSSDNIFTIFIY